MESQVPEIPVTEPPKPKDNHWITILSMALFVVASLSITAFLYYQNQQLKSMLASYQNTPSPTPTTTPVESPTATSSGTPTSTSKACTQEAKLCSDGSYVGREGLNCEFTPCP